MAVTIIDAPCGAGKTEYAIAYMNAHPENSFIFITPYLKEIERIKQGTKVAFYDPKNYQRPDLLGGDFRLKSKLDDFNHLLAQGKDIATTHATFTAATQETINILEDNSYHLIIDEAVDVLTPLNDIVDSPKNRVNKKDVSLMLNNGIITVEENCRVRWTGGCLSVDDEEAHSYCEVQRYAENGTLLLIDGSFFLWEFPIELFEAVESVTILTYRIEGSFLHPYLQLHDIECKKMSVAGSYGKGFNLVPYNTDPAHLQRWKQLIISELQKLSDNGTITLVEQEELERLKRSNAELETTLARKKEIAALDAAEANKEYVNSYNKTTQGSNQQDVLLAESDAIWKANKDLLNRYQEYLAFPTEGIISDEELQRASELSNRLEEINQAISKLVVINTTNPNPDGCFDGAKVTTGKDLPALVEFGQGHKFYSYDFHGKGGYMKPRPFTRKTLERLKQSKAHIAALKAGLKRQEVKTQ